MLLYFYYNYKKLIITVSKGCPPKDAHHHKDVNQFSRCFSEIELCSGGLFLIKIVFYFNSLCGIISLAFFFANILWTKL